MELDLKTEYPKEIKSTQFLNTIKEIYGDDDQELTQDAEATDGAALLEKTEKLLKRKAGAGDEQAVFLLGQLYYEEGLYAEANRVFGGIKDTDPRALYQLAVIHFDGLGTATDYTKGVEYMREVASCQFPEAASIRRSALYNLGRAYMEGYGVRACSDEAERCWLLAAADPNASAKAQSSLGMFYSRPESLDLERAFFWHSEACGNGSLESQGALGVMYLHGQGVHRDLESALRCLKEASDRGNVYAQGHLVDTYYRRKLYSRAAALAQRISEYKDVAAIARATDCLPEYVTKGVAIALFCYARCLQLGRGVQPDQEKAMRFFTKASLLDREVYDDMQTDVTHGEL